MHVTIEISGDVRSLEEADEVWVTQQVNRRRRNSDPVCVRVAIDTGALNLVLTAGCNGSNNGGGGRAPNAREREIFDLWDKLGLGDGDFTGGNLNAFLKQLRHKID